MHDKEVISFCEVCSHMGALSNIFRFVLQNTVKQFFGNCTEGT